MGSPTDPCARFGPRIRVLDSAPDSGPDSGPGFGSRIQVPGSGPRFGSRWTSSRQANHVPAARPVQGQQSKRQCSSTSTRTSAGFEYYRSHPHEHLSAISISKSTWLSSKNSNPSKCCQHASKSWQATKRVRSDIVHFGPSCNANRPYHFMIKSPFFGHFVMFTIHIIS